jgi:acetylornithine/N-succinyldiaminopimelate aminotransferase
MIDSVLPVYSRAKLEFIKGKGAYLFDKGGKKYLDFAGGIAVNSLGYSHPILTKALIKAAKKPWHVSNLYQISGQTQLADKLVANSFADSVFFCNSGTEAIEAGIKFIRKYFTQIGKPNKKNIITFAGAFHGRTIAAISASGNKKYQEGFEPLLEGFINIDVHDFDISKVRKAINKDTAAILIEPIQGEGGIIAFPGKFLKELRKLATEKKILLFLDEVQCGIGRTGKLFYHQWFGIKPDILASAKGIGGGFPLAACLISEEIGQTISKGSHGGTYGGNPLAMQVGNAVIDTVLKKGFLENVIVTSKFFKEELLALQKSHPKIIEEVRGEGLMLGLKLSIDCSILADKLRVQGLLTVPAAGNVIRFLPPLIIKEKQAKEAIKIIKNTLHG